MVNILLNQYFNPAIIAARAIAQKIDTATVSLSTNFNTAIRPQIIKSYASGEKDAMLLLMFRSAKFTYLLMYLFALPLLLEMPMVLKLWLKNVPEFSVLFTRLMMIDVLITSIFNPLMGVVLATGKIKLYQSVVSGILFLNVPLSWIVLHLKMEAYTVLIVAIILTIIASIARLFIIKRLISYSIMHFIKKVILPITVISVFSAILPIIVYYYFDIGLLRLILIISISILSLCLFSYIFGLNIHERQRVKFYIKKYLAISSSNNQ